ncbi:hypothetical protein ACFWYW_56620 [Nonomuraea sp. NPDC059023]|uniref:hypothetical protein n=1 Tax=unclassified Nonomuraea TaxID=2593643 RepID=UPI0036A23EA9
MSCAATGRPAAGTDVEKAHSLPGVPQPQRSAAPLPKIPLDDPRVLALAKARQQFGHDCASLPTWEELTDEERGTDTVTDRRG